MPASRHVGIVAEVSGVDISVGHAFFSGHGNRLSTTFTYSEEWLSRPDAWALDPHHPLSSRTRNCAGLPGFLKDCSPDRWGRGLIQRASWAESDREGQARKILDDVDYLLGVSDLSRMGCLRLVDDKGHHLAPGKQVPKLVELPRLLDAANRVQDGPHDLDAVKDLLQAGSSSLGGARPKTVVNDGGRLHIAKFPSPRDEWDVMALEAFALTLASKAGIRAAALQTLPVDGRTVIVEPRFDRDDQGGRLGYMSAMTLLGLTDGSRAAYYDLAGALGSVSGRPKAAVRELFRRIMLSVAVHNTDDHMRNHGLTLTGGSWTLSPAFDINPNPDGQEERQTSIFGHTGDGEVTGLVELHGALGLKSRETAADGSRLLEALRYWESTARKAGAGSLEISLVRPVIEAGIDKVRRFVGLL